MDSQVVADTISFDDFEEELETEKTPFYDEVCDLMRGEKCGCLSAFWNSSAYNKLSMRERIYASIRETAKSHERQYQCTIGPWHCHDNSIIASVEEIAIVIDELRAEGFQVSEGPHRMWLIKW